MISFPQLGQFGRLGNQLFQVASTVAHAIRNNTEAVFPLWECGYAFPLCEKGSLARVARFIRGPVTWAGTPYDPGWNYKPLPYWDDMAIHGYLQCTKYWEDVLHPWEIRRLLSPTGSPYGRKDDRCTVHIRRTDYLKLNDYHPAPTLEWYRRAMKKCSEAGARDIVICTDDPMWAEDMVKSKALDVPGLPIRVSTDTELRELALMAASPFHVMANSTFSWWGAYLDPDPRLVIMPSPWFGTALTGLDETQLHVEGWEVQPCQS